MGKNEHFLSIVARALNATDPCQALQQAFENILERGHSARYAEETRNFRKFLQHVNGLIAGRSLDASISQQDKAAHPFIVSCDSEDTDFLMNALIETAATNPYVLRLLHRFAEDLDSQDTRNDFPEIVVQWQGVVIGRLPIIQYPARLAVPNVKPGHFMVSTSIGRLLWEGELSEEDLVWAHARPGVALEMAADTGITKARPSREMILLDGAVTIQAFPGREHGSLRLTIERTHENGHE